jgi:Skp family chaperone for outer membrane proteins
MKNISLAFNVVLLVLIVILFFMYFSLKKSIGSSDNSGTAISASSQKAVRIAYLNADSIDSGYKLMKKLQEDLQGKEAELNNEIEAKGRKLQEQYAAYQQRVQSGNISQLDAQKEQQDMAAKQAEIQQLQGKSQELTNEAQAERTLIRQKIHNLIVDYNKKAHFDYVLEYLNLEGAVLYVNDSLDITRPILSAANKQYADSLQGGSAKH